MKLIIDIPDEDYNVILENANYYIEKHWGLPTVWSAIRNGTPYTERPQGEWVENLMHSTICSNCHGIRRDNRVDYIAFCNKCGAKMRGKEE